MIFFSDRLLHAGVDAGVEPEEPPEVLRGESPSASNDVWGAGLCSYLMLAGRLPRRADQYHGPLPNVTRGGYKGARFMFCSLRIGFGQCWVASKSERRANGGF